MAYRSRLFDVADDRRRTAEAGAAPAAPAAAPGGGFGSPSPAPAGGEPGGVNALRAFFEANRGAGSKLLSDTADRISKQFQSASDTAADALTRTERVVPGATGITEMSDIDRQQLPYYMDPIAPKTVTEFSLDPKKMGDAQAAYDKAVGERNSLTSGDMSGIQSLLPQSGSQMGRTLDAWLMQSASTNPSALRGLNSAEARARDIIERQLKIARGGASSGSTAPAPAPGAKTPTPAPKPRPYTGGRR